MSPICRSILTMHLYPHQMHRRCVRTKDVIAKADTLLWSINDYPALATMAGRRVTRGYKLKHAVSATKIICL